jgi:hypothetical protein
MKLLTTKEAAARLCICKADFLKLKLPHVELGPRKFRFREEDIEAFINARVRYPADPESRVKNGRASRSARQWEVGVPKILSPKDLAKVQMGHGKGSEGGV